MSVSQDFEVCDVRKIDKNKKDKYNKFFVIYKEEYISQTKIL